MNFSWQLLFAIVLTLKCLPFLQRNILKFGVQEKNENGRSEQIDIDSNMFSFKWRYNKYVHNYTDEEMCFQ